MSGLFMTTGWGFLVLRPAVSNGQRELKSLFNLVGWRGLRLYFEVLLAPKCNSMLEPSECTALTSIVLCDGVCKAVTPSNDQ